MTIELNRRFVQCGDDERSDPDIIAQFGRSIGALGWADLLSKRRVVLLAEAGSGKTTEMQARARALRAQGRAAFYATVEDVGHRGVTLRSGTPIACGSPRGAPPRRRRISSLILSMKQETAA